MISALTDHLGYWARQLSNHVSQAFAQKLATAGVTVAEWVMLRILHGAEPIAPSALADEMGMTRGAITKLADRMIARGLLVRSASQSDGRAQTLALTPAAAKLVPQLATLADRNDAECFGHLSAGERATLRALLVKSVAALGISATPID